MAQQDTTWIEQMAANNNIIIVINNTLFKTDATKIPLPRQRSGGIVIAANISGWLLCNGGE